MAIVSRKVSAYSIAPLSGISRTLSAPNRYCSSELRQMIPINPKANHGTAILLFSLQAPELFRRPSTKPMTTSTGASIITRIILVIVAVPAIPNASVGSIALPAPAT